MTVEMFYLKSALVYNFMDKQNLLIHKVTMVTMAGELSNVLVSKQNHKATSCVCFAFLTHGDKCGDLYARDRTYQFRDVTMMIESGDAGLVGKPKLFFVQVLLCFIWLFFN